MPTFYAIDPRDPERETAIKVEFTITHHGSAPQTYGPPEICDPGETAEITLDAARDVTGDVLGLLTADQCEAIENEIIAEYDFDGRDDYYDGDY